MGKIYTAECPKCNRIYNFDVGISNLYNKKDLMNYNGDFNLLVLFKEKKRKKILEQILSSKSHNLLDDYGYKIMICDTCKSFYSRFNFTLMDDKQNVFETIYRCHTCRKKLRKITDDEILHNIFECPKCENKIKFHLSGKWN